VATRVYQFGLKCWRDACLSKYGVVMVTVDVFSFAQKWRRQITLGCRDEDKLSTYSTWLPSTDDWHAEIYYVYIIGLLNVCKALLANIGCYLDLFLSWFKSTCNKARLKKSLVSNSTAPRKVDPTRLRLPGLLVGCLFKQLLAPSSPEGSASNCS